ncbi:MAG: hypothetical protein C0490_23090 [Marivirga sp.]|nr:hypothetical protein [Marivirga sp.]
MLVSTLIMLIGFLIKGDKRRHWQMDASGLLFAGCLSAWFSIYTGDLEKVLLREKYVTSLF